MLNTALDRNEVTIEFIGPNKNVTTHTFTVNKKILHSIFCFDKQVLTFTYQNERELFRLKTFLSYGLSSGCYEFPLTTKQQLADTTVLVKLNNSLTVDNEELIYAIVNKQYNVLNYIFDFEKNEIVALVTGSHSSDLYFSINMLTGVVEIKPTLYVGVKLGISEDRILTLPHVKVDIGNLTSNLSFDVNNDTLSDLIKSSNTLIQRQGMYYRGF